MKRFPAMAAVVVLLLSVPAFGQGFFATVSGTVTDSSGALIPGVSVKATAVDTGVVTTTITNESGAYTYGNLLPGKYTLNASLPGFQSKNLTDIQLNANTPYRYNFELTIASVATQVEVSVSAENILATSGGTVGQVLTQEKVQDLPLVGNNILDLITVMAGVENIVPTNPPSAANAFGRENTTFAGVRADNISVMRDGIQMQDNRNPNGIYSVTTINPDLVGEIRLILAPVDVEMGRGNGSIQYTTRSGTNRYNGSAVWSVRNTALDPNSWTNNRNQTVPPNSPPGTVPVALRPNWANTNQVTVSYGGPIIRNKTFFFALYDINRVRGRSLSNFTTLTPCARMGIFRYFNGWNNGNVNQATGTGTQAQRAVVDAAGNPVAATGLPSGSTLVLPTPYDNSLQSISVFGPLASRPTTNDCSDAAINKSTLVPNGVNPSALPGQGGGWDRYRVQLDPTAYISRVMALFPMPNNYEAGDGLNTAGHRLLRHYRGVDNLFGSGEATGDREQYNVKIDQNFSNNHKANFNISYEQVDSDDVYAMLPAAPFSNLNYRRPMVLSGGFTSTLSPSLLNEARFGMRRNGINVIAPWHRPEMEPELSKILPPAVNGQRVISNFTGNLGLCNPHSGSRPPGSGCIAVTGTSYEKTPTTTYSDTVSWSHGAHSFRFNGEVRLNSTQTRVPTTGGFGSANSTFLTVTGGSITGTTQGTTSATDIASTNPVMTGLVGVAGGTGNQNAVNARSLQNYLAASVGNVQTLYFLTDPNNTSRWSDFQSNGEFITLKAIVNEYTAWAKDEWKVTRNLTLTPGLRWDLYGAPHMDSGLTAALVGGGNSAFGISGRDFTGWLNPGVRGDVTKVELVGPKSPNPDRSAYNAPKTNFGPSLSFAWQVPWLGEGRTVMRGGYQITYQGRNFGTVVGAISSAPGSTFQANLTEQNIYRDLTSFRTSIPVPNVAPLQSLLTTGPRSANFTAFDENYTSPYTQNLTLSITTNINRNLSLDTRYIGTLSRKNFSSFNLNINNFLYNGLFDALEKVRTGTEITKQAGDPLSLLDQMFKGINLCTTGCTAGPSYGAIGTTVSGVYQTAAYQMRSSNTFNGNLSNANFNGVAGSIVNLNYSNTGTNASLPAIPAGVVGAAIRLNGFPDNFIRTNPQFGQMNLLNNNGYNNYHSWQTQLTMRPIAGFSGTVTYNWSKNLGLGTITNPANRAADYTNIGGNPTHSFRSNGIVELPIGPNKLLFGNSSGWVARAIERWQLGLIWNVNSGAPASITADSMLYGNGVPDVRHAVDLNKLKGVRWGAPAGSQLEGRYFDNNDVFVKVDDPLCFTVTSQQNLSGLAPATGSANLRCSLNALAMVVPANTPDSQLLPDGRTVQVILQHAQPGQKGNLGNNPIVGLGSWRFDANLSKSFVITESKSLALRIDMQNVMNHPQPGGPNLSITGTDPFGQITGKTGARLLQGQVRLTF